MCTWHSLGLWELLPFESYPLDKAFDVPIVPNKFKKVPKLQRLATLLQMYPLQFMQFLKTYLGNAIFEIFLQNKLRS